MFKKIAFATSGLPSCEAAARVAFDIANRYDAELYTIHVFGIPHHSFSQRVTDVRTWETVDLHDDYIAGVKKDIEAMYADQVKNTKACTFEITHGIPYTEILRFARKQQIDLIVMGARSEKVGDTHEHREMIIGNTLQGVARASRCPVLVIGRPAASFWGGISNIIFGTDFSKASDSAFAFAHQLAGHFNCSLHLFHALDLSKERNARGLSQETIEDRLKQTRAKIRKKYISQMGDFNDYEVAVWEGTPYVELVKYAREQFADLIVMAHHTKKIRPDSEALGSTIEQVALRSNCPVISVNHPDKIGKPEK